MGTIALEFQLCTDDVVAEAIDDLRFYLKLPRRKPNDRIFGSERVPIGLHISWARIGGDH